MILLLILSQIIQAGLGSLALREDPWRLVPQDAVMAIVVHDPQRIADFLFSYIDLLEMDDRFTDVLTDEPHPLLKPSEVAALFAEANAYRHIAKDVDSITLVIGEFSPKIRYGINVRFRDINRVDALKDLQLGDRLTAIFSLLTSELSGLDVSNDQAEDRTPSPDLTTLAPELWTDLKQDPAWQELRQEILLPLKLEHVEFVGRSLIFSNDQSLFALMVSITDDPNFHTDKTILSDRRFRRAYQRSEVGQIPVATAYCRPMDSLPWFQSVYTPEYLETRGYSQLVGAWCELHLGTHWNSTTESPAKLKISVPHTVPPEAIVQSWQAAVPIRTAPDFRPLLDMLDTTPRRLKIENSNRAKQWEFMEQYHRSRRDEHALEAEIAEAVRIAGDVDSYNQFWDGYKLEFTFDHVEKMLLRRFITFMRTEHPELAKSYVRSWIQRSDVGRSYPKVRYQFGDFEGWFMTDDGHRNQAIMDGVDETFARTSPWVWNYGRVATDRWILGMDRCIFDLLEEKEPEEVPIQQLLEDVDPLLVPFVIQVQPWWMDAWFSSWRTLTSMTDMRFWYFKRSLDLDGKRRSIEEFTPYKSISIIRPVDRLYQAVEHAICVGSDAWGTDVHAFANHNGWFEFHWQALPKVSP